MQLSQLCQFLMAYGIASARCRAEAEKQTSSPASQPPAHWNYDDQTEWSEAYPFCEGKQMRQSPIDIITDDVIERDDLAIEFIDYDQALQIKAKNSGHSVSVSPQPFNNETRPRVRLNWMDEEFELQEVHFHWGQGVDQPGSEHRINGQQAAAEMHMVHFQKGVTKDQIGDVPDSVTVVGVFIMPKDGHVNKELEDMIITSQQVNGTDTTVQVSGSRTENPRDLLPETINRFYTYAGSLTTPPCYETVNWIVLSNPIYLSTEKLAELENIDTSDESGTHKINKNLRDVQPLVDRAVYSSTNVQDTSSEELQTQRQANNPEFPDQ